MIILQQYTKKVIVTVSKSVMKTCREIFSINFILAKLKFFLVMFIVILNAKT